MKLTEKQIKTNQDEIISLLRSTNREGMENVIEYLNKSGFFTAPSSLDRHHNWRGGLAEHCLGVCRKALQMGSDLAHESIVIAGLLHDICKASKLYYDAEGNVHRRCTLIKGHGRRSLILLCNCGLQLTEDEALAIRWHMGGHHAHGEDTKEVLKAKQSQLWKIVHKADQWDASRMHRRTNDSF